MNSSLLQKLGLAPKEVDLYLKLLELGSSSAHSLSLRIGENRTTTYSLLLSLEKKGFISYFKKAGVKYFVPTDPGIIINNYMEGAKSLQNILPQLLAITNTSGQKPKITFYEGVQGIKQICEILLEVPGSVRESFMSVDPATIHPEIKRYFDEDFVNRRIENKILYRGIVVGQLPIGNKYPATLEGQLREIKYIDAKKFPIKNHIDIFPKNKVALYSYHKDEMMGVIIEHEDFYITMKTVFKLAWRGVDMLSS